jgi:hypothetical protein
VGYCRIPVTELVPVNETLRPRASPTNAEFPYGWKVQGWFPLRADALSNHKWFHSRRAENVKPIGQVLLRLMIRGSSAGKHAAGEAYVDEDDVKSVASDAEAAMDDRRGDLERKAELRGERLAANLESEFVERAIYRPLTLTVQATLLRCSESVATSRRRMW